MNNSNIKSIITFFFLSLSINVNAQVSFDVSPFWLPQTNWLLNENDYNASRELDYALSYSLENAGLLVGLQFSKSNIGFELGGLYSKQGQRYLHRLSFENGGPLEFNSTTELVYLKFPLLFSYKSNDRNENRLGFYAQLGPQFSWLLSAKSDLDNPSGLEEVTDAYEQFNIDLVLGVGGIFSLTEYIGIFTVLRFDYSLNDIEQKNIIINSESYFNADRLATNAVTVGLATGLQFRF